MTCRDKYCPNRSATCHNVTTCEYWARHEKQKTESYDNRALCIMGQPYGNRKALQHEKTELKDSKRGRKTNWNFSQS